MEKREKREMSRQNKNPNFEVVSVYAMRRGKKKEARKKKQTDLHPPCNVPKNGKKQVESHSFFGTF
jgi:hypothetical protein